MSRSSDNRPVQCRLWPASSAFPVPQGQVRQSRRASAGQDARAPIRVSNGRTFSPVTVREGDKVFPLPAITAVVRQTVRQALKGSSPAQRKVIEVAQKIAQETVIATDNKAEEMPQNITDADRAQALAVFLARTGMKMVPKND